MRRRELLRTGLALPAVGLLGRSVAADRSTGFEPLGRVAVPGAREAVVSDDGRTAYVATGDGYASVDLAAPSDPRVLATESGLLADREGGPLEQIFDVAVEGDGLLVVGPAHGGHELHAAVLVDVTDPADPRQIAVHETDFPIHNADLAGGHAYLTGNDGEGNPLVVVDVRDDPAEVGRWSLAEADPAWGEVPAGLRSLHDVSVRGSVAVLAHWDAGTWLVDVTDPSEPATLTGVVDHDPAALIDLERSERRRERLTPPGNDHYATLDETGTLLAVGAETWGVEVEDRVVGGPSGVALYDVSDPDAPRRLATVEPPPTPDPTLGGVWTTAHNFDLRDGVLYASWYRGGVTRHDLSDPTRPVRTAWWRDPETARFWTAQLAVPGGFFVASSMGTEEGDSALYVFPDEPRDGSAPQSRNGSWEAASAGATPTTSAEMQTSATPVAGTNATATESASATTTDGGDTGAEAPGFGLLGAAAAVCGAGWWLGHRKPRERP